MPLFLSSIAAGALITCGFTPTDPAPEPSSFLERSTRAARARLFEERYSIPLPDLPPGAPVPPLIMERPPIRELPFDHSAAVMIGRVAGQQTFLSSDRTQLYTEFSVAGDEIFKNERPDVKAGVPLTILVEGGALRLTSGRILRQEAPGDVCPLQVGPRYVLFLEYWSKADAFQILAAWELRDNSPVPLEPGHQALAKHGKCSVCGQDEAQFLIGVRAASRASK